MKGAILGDIAGSAYEFKPVKSKTINLFPPGAEFTDDTVLTVAVADAIMHGKSYSDAIIEWGRLYPHMSYGMRFRNFLHSSDPKPYNSFGNGSAMRVSPVAWAWNDEDKVLEEARKTAEVSHNHPEGIKGAQATALAIFMSRKGAGKEKIRQEISSRFDYDLNRTVNEIRLTYSFNETCQETVPEAIISFLDAEDVEDAVRNAISLGGDADTLAAITGSIAEAYYGGIPDELWKPCEKILDGRILKVVDEWTEFL